MNVRNRKRLFAVFAITQRIVFAFAAFHSVKGHVSVFKTLFLAF